MWIKKLGKGHPLTVCHYCMLTWQASHYNSWQLFGHSHGRLQKDLGKQYDIGVDNNNFYPISYDQVKEIMKNRPDNFNCVLERKTKNG